MEGAWCCNPVDLVQIHFGPPARNGEENGQKMDYGLTRQMGEIWLENWEGWPDNGSESSAKNVLMSNSGDFPLKTKTCTRGEDRENFSFTTDKNSPPPPPLHVRGWSIQHELRLVLHTLHAEGGRKEREREREREKDTDRPTDQTTPLTRKTKNASNRAKMPLWHGMPVLGHFCPISWESPKSILGSFSSLCLRPRWPGTSGKTAKMPKSA